MIQIDECSTTTGIVTKRQTETVSDKLTPLRNVGPRAGW